MAENAMVVSLRGSLTQGKSLADLVRRETKAPMGPGDGSKVLLVDVSGSMGAVDKDGVRAIDAMRNVVREIQSMVPCRVAAFGWLHGVSKYVDFVDEIPEPNGGTPMMQGIDFARAAAAKHLVIVSDGQPDDRDGAMRAAKEFPGKIDVCYVGPDDERGREFLKRLAKSTGGDSYDENLSQMKQLVGRVVALLGDGSHSGGAIQL